MTSSLIGDDVTIRVSSGKKSEESVSEEHGEDLSLNSSEMEKFDGLLSLSDDKAVESAASVDETEPLSVSDAIDVLGNKSEDLVLDSEILSGNDDEEISDVADSGFEMSDVSVSRFVELGDLVDDSENDLLDEDELENTFFASSEENGEILFESNDVELRNECVGDSDEIEFDLNDADIDDLDVVEFEEDADDSESDEIIFDSNDFEIYEIEEDDEADADEIVFDSNDVEIYEIEEDDEADADEIVFDSNDVEIYEIEEDDEADSDEIVFDSNDVEIYEIEEDDEADSDEIVFDSNDVESKGDDSLEEMSQLIWGLNTDEDLSATDSFDADETISELDALEDEELADDVDESIATLSVDDEEEEGAFNDVASTSSEDIGSYDQDLFEFLDGIIDEDNLSALPLEEDEEGDSLSRANGDFQILLKGSETEPHVSQNAQTDAEDSATSEEQLQEQEEEEPDFFELVNPAVDENASFSNSSDAAVDKQKMMEETSNDSEIKEILYDSTERASSSFKSSQVELYSKSDASSDKTVERFVPFHVGGGAAPLVLPVCEPGNSEVPEPETREYRRARILRPFRDEYQQDLTQEVPGELEDEFWVIEQNIGSASFWKRNGDRWSQETVKGFLAGDDSSRVTIFWAHGYQTSLQDATQDGLLLKKKLDSVRSEFGIQRRYRLVVWRWNSEREYARLRIDAKEKKFFAHQCGVELGKFIGKMSPKSDVSLIGFSFGATLTGSALETLATTQNRYLDARRTLQEGETRGRVSLVLMSAACDLGSFLKGGAYSHGAILPERVLNMYNPNDGALHFYPFVSSTAQAQGVAPLTGNEFPSASGATYNLNMNAALGKEHTFVGALSLFPSQTLATILF
ncbi:MAG: hypothetical protein ACI4NP_03795 [Thermoguttaceae bacterium]